VENDTIRTTVYKMEELIKLEQSKKWQNKEKIYDGDKIYYKHLDEIFMIIDTVEKKYAIKVFKSMQLKMFTQLCDYYEKLGYKREYGEEIWQNL